MKTGEKFESKQINRAINLCYLSFIVSFIAVILNLISIGAFKWILTKIVSCF
jgi:hypothetical protein